MVLTSLYLIRVIARFLHAGRVSSSASAFGAGKKEPDLGQRIGHAAAYSRGIHDEFGQVLTAIGSTLGPLAGMLRKDRLRRRYERGAGERAIDLKIIYKDALPGTSSRSLEEAGLESTFDWYIPTVGRQMGLQCYEKTGQGRSRVERSAGAYLSRACRA